MPGDLIGLSGIEQAELIRTRKISPVELVQACLDQIERWDKTLRAWITLDPQRALKLARQAEKDIANGDYRGPLHGLPYGIKDQIHALGFPTTLGTKVLDPNEMDPPLDANVVERLNAAGAILLGKQNLFEFGKGGATGFPYGQPRNPWNPIYSASGSSTGSGIAPAANMCTFSLGVDTGGSVRGPAACNGIVGMRPTFGRVSRHGAVMASYTIDTIGPLARTVSDVAQVLQAIAGYDERDPLSSVRPVEPYAGWLTKPLRGVRLAVIGEIAWGPGTNDEVKSAFEAALEVLKHEGAEISEVSLPWAAYSVPLQFLSSDADVASGFAAKYLRERYERFDVGIRTRLAAASLMPASLYNRAMRARVLVRRQILDALQRNDALISPTMVTPPKPIRAKGDARVDPRADAAAMEQRIEFHPFSIANVPAISVPMGFAHGDLPLGLQIAGRPFAEGQVLQIAHAYEQATKSYARQPNLERTLAAVA